MVTLNTADQALKNLYLDVVKDQINFTINPFFARIKQTTNDVWGKEIKKLVHYGINGGVGAGSETGNLPKSGENFYQQLTLSLKNLYGTISISDKAVRASQNNAGAFVNLLNAEMEGLVKACSFNFGRMLFGDGSGMLAKTTDITGNVVTVDNVKNLVDGMTVDFLDEDGLAYPNARGVRIMSIDRANKKMKINVNNLSNSSVPAGSMISLQNSYMYELTGLGKIFDTSSMLYGLVRDSHRWLNPLKKTNVGEITENVIQQVIDELDESNGSRINFIVCSSGVKRAFVNHLNTYKRNIDVMDLQGGFKALSYNGIPIVSDRFCPDGTMYLLNTDDFQLHQLCDWKWLEGEDGKVLKQVNGTPVYTATLVKYADLLCSKPCGQAMLTGITEA
ncbi:MAG: phage major capsid protein [Christensenellaceae bacterium]